MSDSVGKVIAETLAEARKRASGHRNAYREYMMDGGTGNHSGGALANAYVWMCNQLLVLESLARQHREEVEAAEAALGEAQSSRDWYKRRCDALQAVQDKMRDPERKAVCDILANGSTEVFTRTSKETSNG